MIYLDNGATTLIKPPEVARSVAYAVNHLSSPGRGGYWSADQAAETAYHCRELASELLGGWGPEGVVFTSGATAALNTALRSLLAPGDHVIISGFEHNAVTRTLEDIGGLHITVLKGGLFQPEVMLEDLEACIQPNTKAVVLCHVSNVFGYVLPMDQLAEICRRHKVPLVVDAAQSAGAVKVDLSGWGAAYVACPGHKGLYGPQGIGLLLCGEGADPRPLITGGTGSDSIRVEMPEYLPDRLEAGTHNMPGICGLMAGLEFVKRMGVERIGRHERALRRRLVYGMKGNRRIEVFAHPTQQLGVVSFRIRGRDCEEIAAKLAEQGIALRAGLHCAPLAHRTAGTVETGTIRASFSAFSSARNVDELLFWLTEKL